MSTDTAPLTITCSRCDRTTAAKPTTAGEPKLPRNWKRLGSATLCRDCVAASYVPRGAWLPVATVVSGYDVPAWTEEVKAAGWKALRPALRASWRTAAQLYNWALVEFARTDGAAPVPNRKGTGQVPGPWDRKAAVKTVRALCKTRFPEIDQHLDSQSKYALLAKAEGDYVRTRFERQILCKSTLPEATAGRLPLPIPVESVRSLGVTRGCVIVALRLAGQRFTLALQAGHRFRRQVGQLERALSGAGRVGELKIQERGRDIMVGFSLLLPKEQGERRDVLIRVCTAPDRLWQVFVGDREESWNLNDDPIRRLSLAYREQLRRISEDLKMERRRPHEHSAAFDAARGRLARKYANRWGDYCHKAAAILSGLAARHAACRVEYDDSAGGFFGDLLPRFKLRERVAEKLAQIGVEFVHVNGSDDGGRG